MKQIAQIISGLALAATIVPAILFLNDRLELGQVKQWMLLSTVVWFVTVPLWMNRKPAAD